MDGSEHSHGPLARARRIIGMAWLFRNPLVAYRRRLFMKAGDDPASVTYKLRNGPILHVHDGPSDIRIINEIWIDRCYEFRPELVPQDGWTILDIGSHKGIYAARVLMLAPAAQLFCFEPDPENFRYLQENVGGRVVARNVAVGSQAATMTLYKWPGQTGRNTLIEERAQRLGGDRIPIEVPQVALDEAVRSAGGHIDLMKIDVEGVEYDLVLNADPSTYHGVDRIVFEYDAYSPYDSSTTWQDLRQALLKLGFTVDVREEIRTMTALRRG
jgi:FkbM family methyltransferase